MLRQLVNDIEKKPIAITMIADKIENSKHFVYTDLFKVKDINQLFGQTDCVLILLNPPSKNVGHFCLLIKRPNKVIWFDPYGNDIKYLIKILGLPDVLLRLLQGVHVVSNTIRYEKVSRKINTCGLHCIFRAKFRHYDSDMYRKLTIYKNLRPDEIVVISNLMNFDLPKLLNS